MPVKIKRLLKELKDGLVRIYGDRLKGLYLYGSYARGEAQAESAGAMPCRSKSNVC